MGFRLPPRSLWKVGGEVDVGDRRPKIAATQGERDVADRADVLRDVVAGGAVTAGGCVFQGAIFVKKGHGHAIDFWLQGYGDFLTAQVFLEAFVKGDELGFGSVRVFQLEHIVDAEHRDGVLDLGETVERFRADALGGRVGIGEGGVAFFEVFEFAEELVVFGVGDFRLGIGVVEPVVVVDELPQLRDARIGRGEVGEKIQLVGHGRKLQTSRPKLQGRVAMTWRSIGV